MKHATGIVTFLLASAAALSCAPEEPQEEVGQTSEDLQIRRLPNGLPIPNVAGFASTVSSQGHLDLTNAFHTPQGTNGRSCATCHALTAGWTITADHAEILFELTGGRDPLFHPMDANRPDADVSTVKARRASYSMLRKGVFRRGGPPPAGAEYRIVAADDPHGVGNTTTFSFYRRPLATANLHPGDFVHWDLGVPDLTAQARGNIINGQQAAEPPSDAVLAQIVAYEKSLSFAQDYVWGVGRLDACGAKGGVDNLRKQPFVSGRFDLFDAWGSGPCSKSKAHKKIYRGQELFNTKQNARGGTCNGCHDAANHGANVAGRLFDIGASRGEFRTPDLPVYTVENIATGERRDTMDPGRAFRTGKWEDMDRFKVPSLRGVVARAPYFHNGIARTLHDVVRFYEQSLGFDFTPEEEDDLVAFLSAL